MSGGLDAGPTSEEMPALSLVLGSSAFIYHTEHYPNLSTSASATVWPVVRFSNHGVPHPLCTPKAPPHHHHDSIKWQGKRLEVSHHGMGGGGRGSLWVTVGEYFLSSLLTASWYFAEPHERDLRIRAVPSYLQGQPE